MKRIKTASAIALVSIASCSAYEKSEDQFTESTSFDGEETIAERAPERVGQPAAEPMVASSEKPREATKTGTAKVSANLDMKAPARDRDRTE